jgi:hypothetical protein
MGVVDAVAGTSGCRGGEYGARRSRHHLADMPPLPPISPRKMASRRIGGVGGVSARWWLGPAARSSFTGARWRLCQFGPIRHKFRLD